MLTVQKIPLLSSILFLTEETVQTTRSRYALTWRETSENKTYILYDVLFLENLLQFPRLKHAVMGSNLDTLLLDYEVVTGMIQVEESDNCSGFYVVRGVAAKPGFGPLMYEIALSSPEIQEQRGLLPDDNDVTNKAKAVWEKFYERDDVETIPVETPCPDYHTKSLKNKVQTKDFVPMAIKLKNPIDVTSLVFNHENVRDNMMREYSQKNGFRISGHSLETNLVLAADKFFRRAYL